MSQTFPLESSKKSVGVEIPFMSKIEGVEFKKSILNFSHISETYIIIDLLEAYYYGPLLLSIVSVQ